MSLLLPATVILLALGALIGESGIAFWPIWAAAAVGAFFGDWLSYWIGYHYQDRVAHMWPLSRNPQLLARGHAFFERWGVLGIFIGRFFGPLRAVVPLVGGICGMPQRYFQLANVTSAMIWAFGILAPGHSASSGSASGWADFSLIAQRRAILCAAGKIRLDIHTGSP